jgi:hypothetical protein
MEFLFYLNKIFFSIFNAIYMCHFKVVSSSFLVLIHKIAVIVHQTNVIMCFTVYSTFGLK